MTADYYSDVQCIFSAERKQLDTWLETFTSIGERLAPAGLYDVEFSAIFSKSVMSLGIQAAHVVRLPRPNAQTEAWRLFSIAQSHAFDLLAQTDALTYLNSMLAELTRTVGDEELTLTYTTIGPTSIKVTQVTNHARDAGREAA